MDNIGNNRDILGYDDLDIDGKFEQISHNTDTEAREALQGSTVAHLNRLSLDFSRDDVLTHLDDLRGIADTRSVISCRSVHSVKNGGHKKGKGHRLTKTMNSIVANEEDHIDRVAKGPTQRGSMQEQKQEPEDTHFDFPGVGAPIMFQQHGYPEEQKEAEVEADAEAVDAHEQKQGPYVSPNVGQQMQRPSSPSLSLPSKNNGICAKAKMLFNDSPATFIILILIAIVMIVFYTCIRQKSSVGSAMVSPMTTSSSS